MAKTVTRLEEQALLLTALLMFIPLSTLQWHHLSGAAAFSSSGRVAGIIAQCL